MEDRIKLRAPVYDKEKKRIVRYRRVTVNTRVWLEQKELQRKAEQWLRMNPKEPYEKLPNKPNPAWIGFVEDDGTEPLAMGAMPKTHAEMNAEIDRKVEEKLEQAGQMLVEQAKEMAEQFDAQLEARLAERLKEIADAQAASEKRTTRAKASDAPAVAETPTPTPQPTLTTEPS